MRIGNGPSLWHCFPLIDSYPTSPSDPVFEETDKRQFGYSRDKRSDCVQVVIGLIITPEGFPLAYEVLPGNTSDKTTLRSFLRKIEEQYGKAERIWLMDRRPRRDFSWHEPPFGGDQGLAQSVNLAIHLGRI